MSLTSALNTTSRGLLATEAQIRITSQNITNADRAGYTRKTYDSKYITTDDGTVPIRGAVNGSIDKFLSAALMDDTSAAQYDKVRAEYLDYYVRQYGNTSDGTTLSGFMNTLFSKFSTLSHSPEITADKAQVVATAQSLTSQMRQISASVQDMRARADQEIAETINSINSSLRQLDQMNQSIRAINSQNSESAEFEDQRMVELESLAQKMDIQYFFSADNQLQIYTGNGQPLLLSSARQITYTPTTIVNSTVLYPAGFQPINLNGADITTQIRGGKLGGLIAMRDTTLVEEQTKLNELATTMMDELNAVLNTGASIPPRSILTGSLEGLTAGTAFSGAGTLRVGVTDAVGVVISYQDLNLAAYATVGALQAALNVVPGVNAIINVDGALEVTAAVPGQGVSFNQMTSSVAPSGRTFSHYFGMNNFLDGTTAEDIDVADYLKSGSEYLASGRFSPSLTLAPGDRGIESGDGSVASALSNLMQADVSFSAAANFAAQNTSLIKYSDAIISNASSRASIAEDEFDQTDTVYKETRTLLDNKSGVNIDEETAKMIELESKYQASARIITTIRDLFQSLLDAVR